MNPNSNGLIREWLNTTNADYMAGVNLFFNATGKVATRDSLVKYYSLEKLKNLLKEIIENENVVIEKTIAVKKSEIIANKDTSKELLQHKNKMQLHWKELSITHAKMGECQTDEERYIYAKKCVDINMVLANLQEEILHYEQYGKFPKRSKVPHSSNMNEEQSKMMLELKLIPPKVYQDKKYIAQYENKMNASKDIEEINKFKKAIENKKKRIENFEIRRLELTNQINNIKNDK